MPLQKVSANSVWAVVINKSPNGTKYLLARRSDTVNKSGLWNFFGGRIDKGEKPRDSVLRELREESGFKFKNINYYGSLEFNGATFRYYTKLVDGKIKPKLNDESDDYKWASRADVSLLELHVPTREFFKHFITPFCKAK